MQVLKWNWSLVLLTLAVGACSNEGKIGRLREDLRIKEIQLTKLKDDIRSVESELEPYKRAIEFGQAAQSSIRSQLESISTAHPIIFNCVRNQDGFGALATLMTSEDEGEQSAAAAAGVGCLMVSMMNDEYSGIKNKITDLNAQAMEAESGIDVATRQLREREAENQRKKDLLVQEMAVASENIKVLGDRLNCEEELKCRMTTFF